MIDRNYLIWLRSLQCVVTGVQSDLVAHHLWIGRERAGVKDDDSLALPLHEYMHDNSNHSLHFLGEREFWTKYGINPFWLCDDLYALYLAQGPVIAAGNRLIRMHRDMAQMRIENGVKVFEART